MRGHSSHRSSMSRSHHSMSHSRSHSSLHRSMSRNHHGGISHSSMNKRHGISNAHAFAVGKATGININGSAMGAHGAALHRMKEMRERNSIHRSSSSNFNRRSSFSRRKSFNNMRVSHTKHRYTSPKYNLENVGTEFGNAMNEASKYIWIPIVIIAFMMIFFIGIFVTFIFNITKIF